MTWIIGSTALCGSASLVSDICVTFTAVRRLFFGGRSSLLAHMVSTSINNGSVPGVSKMFQFSVITRDQYTIHDHEYTISQPDGQNIKRSFPRIDQGRAEFDILSREHLCAAASAEC